jgi:hypothetical protein
MDETARPSGQSCRTLAKFIMKITIPFFVFLSFGALMAPRYMEASPVVEASIPAGIDWFVHVDAEKLYASRAGSAFKAEFQDIVAAQAEGQMPLDPVLIADGVKGLTVFGTMPDFSAEEFVPDAVVVLEGTSDLIQVFKGLVSGFQIEQPEAIVPVENDPNGILSLMNGEIYGSFVGDNHIVVSKALPGLQKFFAVSKGESTHINLEDRFAIYGGDGSAGIFFGAFVEGLDEFEELPVQARILQLTQSVSLQLGEQGDYINLLASLMTADGQTAAQVSEVLKGLIAVAALTHNGNPEIGTLINTADVVLDDQTVVGRCPGPEGPRRHGRQGRRR